MTKTSFKSNTIRRTIVFNGKDIAITLDAAVWEAFQGLCKADKLSVREKIAGWQLNDRDAIVPRIEAAVSGAGVQVVKHKTREQWLGAIVDAMRPEFAHRGYPLPAKITAAIGFPSKGWRGKARGECWVREASADKETSQIYIHPCETSTETIVNILTHELCHAAQDALADLRDKPKQKSGHGKFWKEVAEAMDLTEGKGTHARGGEAWKVWALPIIESAGPLPHSALDEYVKKEKKQTARMLKCECPDCGAIWRTSKKVLDVIAEKQAERGEPAYLNCIDPDCIGKVDVESVLEGREGGEEPEEVPAELQSPRKRKPVAEIEGEKEKRCRICKKADGKPMLGDRYGKHVHHKCYHREQNEDGEGR